MTSSLQKQRRKRRISLIAAVSGLLGLVVYGAVRPDPETREYNSLRDAIVTGDMRSLDADGHQELRRRLDALSPETRQKLRREIMREQVRQAREETKNLTEEEKKQRIAEMTNNVRDGFKNLSKQQRKEMKANMNTEEMKNRMKESLDFYYTEFTAEERKLYDPLVQELIRQFDAL